MKVLTNGDDSDKQHGVIGKLLEHTPKKFNRKSSKVVYFKLSRCYLQSVTKIIISTILEKNEDGIKSIYLDLNFIGQS